MGKLYPGCRALIAQSYQEQGIPKSAELVIVTSLSKGTLNHYNRPLTLWWSYCQENGVPAFSASITQVLVFLNSLLEKVKSYSTLNCYRSALSLIMKHDIASDRRMCRFFKGVSNLRPQKPKYSYVWDPSPVLSLLESWGDNKDMAMEKLSKN